MTNPKVTIIILNWNGEKFLKENIPSVLEQTYKNYNILIADNSSNDNSKEIIDNLVKDNSLVKSLYFDQNHFFAKGNNLAFEFAINNYQSEVIVFLNNDVKVKKDWLENLINGFDDEKIGIVTPLIFLYYKFKKVEIEAYSDIEIEDIKDNFIKYHCLYFPEGFDEKGEYLDFPYKFKKGEKLLLAIPFDDNQVDNCINFNIKKGEYLIKIDGKEEKLKDSGKTNINNKGDYIVQNAGTRFFENRMVFEDIDIFKFTKSYKDNFCDAGCGAGMAVRSDLLKKFGGYNEKYKMYWEDSELSYRFAKNGYKTKFASKSICYHIFWGSSGAKVTETQTFYGTRNRLWFIREYFGIGKYLYYLIRTIGRTVKYFFQMILGKNNSMMFFKQYLKAIIGSLNK